MRRLRAFFPLFVDIGIGCSYFFFNQHSNNHFIVELSRNLDKQESVMKKIIKMSGLDCSCCAAKIEDAVRALEGVKAAGINFLTQKLTIDAEDALCPAVVAESRKIIGRITPDVEILN